MEPLSSKHFIETEMKITNTQHNVIRSIVGFVCHVQRSVRHWEGRDGREDRLSPRLCLEEWAHVADRQDGICSPHSVALTLGMALSYSTWLSVY